MTVPWILKPKLYCGIIIYIGLFTKYNNNNNMILPGSLELVLESLLQTFYVSTTVIVKLIALLSILYIMQLVRIMFVTSSYPGLAQ